MKIENLLTFFIPKDKIFFKLFQNAADNLVEISKLFDELVNTSAMDKRMDLLKKIEDLEHVGDSITHEIFSELSANFITPFDREDIQYLASSIDDIADYIDGSAKRLLIYKIGDYSQAMRQLSEIIMKSAFEIKAAVNELKSMENKLRIREALVRIHSLENHADDVFYGAIASLFEEEKDPIMVIKLKEILENMETATDKCEDAANVIETILIKNS